MISCFFSSVAQRDRGDAAGSEADLHDTERIQQAGDGLGEQYGRRRSERASRDYEERGNVRIRQCGRD